MEIETNNGWDHSAIGSTRMGQIQKLIWGHYPERAKDIGSERSYIASYIVGLLISHRLPPNLPNSAGPCTRSQVLPHSAP